MIVKWLPQAKKQLRFTAKYIKKAFGDNAKDSFLLEIRKANEIISSDPKIGIEEPLLLGRPVPYRSLIVNRLNKIVYRVLIDHIEVSALWNVRREPKKLVEGLK